MLDRDLDGIFIVCHWSTLSGEFRHSLESLNLLDEICCSPWCLDWLQLSDSHREGLGVCVCETVADIQCRGSLQKCNDIRLIKVCKTQQHGAVGGERCTY